MKQYFAYVRVSTAKQGEGVSLEAQQDAITAYAAKHGLSVAEWFEEKETAAKSGRPVFNAMVKQLRAGKACGIIMHKIDRSARNFADWAKIGDLSDAGIDVHFATESLDFRSRGGRLSADIQAVIAADYIRNLREETLKGIRGRLKQGLYPFGAPLGYLNNGKGKAKTPDPERAHLIRDLFDLYGSGQYSIRALVTEMERRGLRNKNDRPVTKSGIETILANPFYCGIIRIQRTGEAYNGVHEPLISASLFDRVQAIKAGKSGKKVTRHNHLFRGLFRCKLCNAAMTPERQKGYVYYRCQNNTCPTKTIREESLDTAIAKLLSAHSLSNEQIEKLDQELRQWFEKRKKKTPATTAPMQLAQIDAKLDTLDDKLLEKIIDDETYQRKRGQLLFEKKKLEEQQREQANEAHEPERVRQFLERVKDFLYSYRNVNSVEKREIAELTTSNRLVDQRNILLEPRNWLTTIDEAVAVLCGAPDRPTSRTHQRKRSGCFEKLIETSKSVELPNVGRDY